MSRKKNWKNKNVKKHKVQLINGGIYNSQYGDLVYLNNDKQLVQNKRYGIIFNKNFVITL